MQARTIARIVDKFHWLINLLPNKYRVKLYSAGRIYFMNKFYHSILSKTHTNKFSNQSRILWGIKFNAPLMNSAGMFKNGEGYDLVAVQGAGGYMGGTSTANPRIGNNKNNIKLPFVTLPLSHTSINYLGLPNLGDDELSIKQITQHKINGCPIGWSVMRSPDYTEDIGLELLVQSLFQYQKNLQIDFIEINESCPNVSTDLTKIENRLVYIADNFLTKRIRQLPVVIKLSIDTDIQYLPKLLDILFKYKFDGVNLGNTSTNYLEIAKSIHPKEYNLFNYFTQTFGGGVGGNILKAKSLALCKTAVDYHNKVKPDYEFHVIRTGGIDSASDIIASNEVGVSLNQWYTGYFTNYTKYADSTYQKF